MGYDLVFRGGRVVDGSGLPSYLADVAIKDGKIVEIGRVQENSNRTIDVHGMVVAPGFIDHHTHMDAQIQWDPYATAEPEHGITSIVMGNDGLALAPVKSGDEHELLTSFVRFEAMPRDALEKGIPWGWHSYGDYLDGLEGRLGINVGGLVGHIPIRHWVMGQEAADRAAKPAEIQSMKQLVTEAMKGGALGFSTNRNERHMQEGSKPIPSGLADDEEFFTLCDALGELNAGVIQSHLGQHKISQFETYDRLVRRTGRPSIGQPVVHRAAAPERWKQQLNAVAPTFRDGYLPYLRTNTIPDFQHFTLKNARAFDQFETWKNLMFEEEETRKRAFGDPQIRHRLREELESPRQTAFRRVWDTVTVAAVANPQNQKYAGKSVEEVGRIRNQDPLDAFLDLALEENLETTFGKYDSGGDAKAMAEILRSPYILVGNSDAGSKVQVSADNGYCTTLLGLWVREERVMSLEQAIHKLTFMVASVYGLEGRGLLRPGYAADLAIFDAATVNAGEVEWLHDFPANTKRLIHRSVGMHYVVVNGRVIYQDGRLTGDLPGQVLRGAAYRAAGAAA